MTITLRITEITPTTPVFLFKPKIGPSHYYFNPPEAFLDLGQWIVAGWTVCTKHNGVVQDTDYFPSRQAAQTYVAGIKEDLPTIDVEVAQPLRVVPTRAVPAWAHAQ